MAPQRRYYDTKKSVRHVHLTLGRHGRPICSFGEAFREERTRASPMALHVQ